MPEVGGTITLDITPLGIFRETVMVSVDEEALNVASRAAPLRTIHLILASIA